MRIRRFASYLLVMLLVFLSNAWNLSEAVELDSFGHNACTSDSGIVRIAQKPPAETRAIPLRSIAAGTALSYHKMPVDLSKPISKEPLVKASDVGLSSKSYYHVADGSNGPYHRQIPGSLPDVWLRQSVANKLRAVNQKLEPLDLELYIYDGYRPIETQQSLWDHFIEKGRHQLKTSDPQKLREFAGKFASDPHGFNSADSTTWPTHNTGGAVDLTLRQKSTGKLLDMGGEFDEASPISFTDALEKERTDDRARDNRRILYDAMTREGFANYPYEWWHYDYGTQMWSQNHSNAEAGAKAFYGPAVLPCAAIGVPADEDRSPSALQARLEEAEKNYKIGKVGLAIAQAGSLTKLTDSSFLSSDQIAREAKADLAVFYLKAGQPDQTAKLMRELLLSLQMELPMDPRFSTNSAQVLAESPKILKDYFEGVIKRLEEKPDTKPIVDSIIDNTVPKDYSAQLANYCKQVEDTTDQLIDLQSLASSEELKYGDPLSSLADADSENKTDPKISADTLEKFGKTLDALATQGQQMPVGDMRGPLALYTLALLANSAERYEQAETFAKGSIAHVTAITNLPPNIAQVRVALAYALLKQGKNEEFKVLRDDLLKSPDDQERLLVTLARFTELSGDNAGAAAIYKRALDARNKRGNTQVPEWMDDYNDLLKRIKQ